jgi:hypothetical protein
MLKLEGEVTNSLQQNTFWKSDIIYGSQETHECKEREYWEI